MKKKVQRTMLHCMLRISSGFLRGLLLNTPKGEQTRPSSTRLRQGTFNVLKHSKKFLLPIDKLVVIDLFAGSGAWGIEAISYGASQGWFVESHPLALRALKENLQKMQHSLKAQNIQGIAVKVLDDKVERIYSKLPQAHLIFSDPPYDKGWFETIDALEALHNRLLPGGVLLFEQQSQEALPHSQAGLLLVDTKIYGDSAVHFFVKQSV